MTKPILAFLNLTHGTDLAQEAWFGSMSVSEVRATDHNGLPFYLFFFLFCFDFFLFSFLFLSFFFFFFEKSPVFLLQVTDYSIGFQDVPQAGRGGSRL